MALTTGSRIGPYEILSPLGAGGMGEVYKARDTRLNRDVAVKILPGSVASDDERLRRFTLEAQSTSALSHPNILVVHDVGADHGIPYVVSELLEGRTLREALVGGALPARKATDYAIQIAGGLAAAHDKGIVHRDLKPDNIFITKDGRAKILDFGLAKLTGPDAPGTGETLATAAAGTTPGIVLGTIGYMSPEQLRGEPVDARSDIFSLGAVMYEMFSGTRAFRGATAVETMSAILKEDPPDMALGASGVSPALDRVVRRCLEKQRDERFQSARDVTFALDAVSNASGASAKVEAPPPAPARGRLGAVATSAVAAAVIVGAAAFFTGRRLAPSAAPQPQVSQLTFRSGTVRGARFTPDPKTVVYAAAWEGRPLELYSARQDSAESSAVNLPAAGLLAISSAGEMAVALRAANDNAFVVSGTLARAPLAGGAARELAEDVLEADFSPDGKQLAAVHRVSGKFQLEYPLGTPLVTEAYWLSNPRVASDGTHVAFISHPIGGDEGAVEVLDVTTRQRRTLSPGWMSIQGLAWAPGGREVWFTATRFGGLRALWAVSTSGVERLVYRAPQRLTLEDIAPDGRVLLTGTTMRSEILFGSVEEKFERKLSWFDWATVVSVSADAKMIAFTESGEGAGEKYGVYVRQTDGSPAIRLGDGSAGAISPDRKWVAGAKTDGNTLQILPTGAGEVRVPDVAPVESLDNVGWFADSTRLVIAGSEKGHPARAWALNLAGGPVTPLTPEGVTGTLVSPDGQWLVIPRDAQNGTRLFSLEGGPVKALDLGPDEMVAGWLADSRSLMVSTRLPPFKVARIDIATGRRTEVATITPGDPDGIISTFGVRFAPDGDHYVYRYGRLLGELFVIDGLK